MFVLSEIEKALGQDYFALLKESFENAPKELENSSGGKTPIDVNIITSENVMELIKKLVDTKPSNLEAFVKLLEANGFVFTRNRRQNVTTPDGKPIDVVDHCFSMIAHTPNTVPKMDSRTFRDRWEWACRLPTGMIPDKAYVYTRNEGITSAGLPAEYLKAMWEQNVITPVVLIFLSRFVWKLSDLELQFDKNGRLAVLTPRPGQATWCQRPNYNGRGFVCNQVVTNPEGELLLALPDGQGYIKVPFFSCQFCRDSMRPFAHQVKPGFLTTLRARSMSRPASTPAPVEFREAPLPSKNCWQDRCQSAPPPSMAGPPPSRKQEQFPPEGTVPKEAAPEPKKPDDASPIDVQELIFNVNSTMGFVSAHLETPHEKYSRQTIEQGVKKLKKIIQQMEQLIQ